MRNCYVRIGVSKDTGRKHAGGKEEEQQEGSPHG